MIYRDRTNKDFWYKNVTVTYVCEWTFSLSVSYNKILRGILEQFNYDLPQISKE